MNTTPITEKDRALAQQCLNCTLQDRAQQAAVGF